MMKFLSLSDDYLAKLEKAKGDESFINLCRRKYIQKIADFYHKLTTEIEKFQVEIRQEQEEPACCVIC